MDLTFWGKNYIWKYSLLWKFYLQYIHSFISTFLVKVSYVPVIFLLKANSFPGGTSDKEPNC